MVIKSVKRVFAIVMLSGMAMTAFAEDAPVYDVDNYPPQFDGQADGGAAGNQAPALQAAPPVVPQHKAPQSFSAAPEPQEAPQPQSMASSLTLDQRMSRVEQQMTNLQQTDASSKLGSLRNEVQSLRGQVEELTHQIQQMQSQQRSMYSDLDKRISKQPAAPVPATETEDTSAISTKTPPKKTSSLKKPKAILTAATIPAGDEPAAEDKAVVTPKPAVAATVAPNTVASANAEQEELQMYQSAYDLIKDSKFDQAIAVLQNMLKKYPTGQSAANAHYWLGELYGLQKKREQAAVEFSTVVTNYPNSPKVSDAQVKLGMIYAAQFKWPEAKSTFKKVISHYPGTTSARLAAQQLKEIKTGGH